MSPSRIRMILAGGFLLVAVVLFAYFLRPRREVPPVPPETSSATPLPPLSTSPFLNTHAGVKYLGDSVCADCHLGQSRTYRKHPMGRSLFRSEDAPAIEQFDHKSNPFQSGPFQFQVVRQGKDLIHKEWCEDAKGNVVARREAPIAFAVGSGSQARSYLVNYDGFLFQSPITWYATRSQWAQSPGYEEGRHHFSRRVDSRCLYCHSSEPRPVEHTSNLYSDPPFGQHAIGCERCHGPGELHVQNRPEGLKPGDIDHTIVNPKHLTPNLRDNVCEQCHLQGESIIARRGRTQLDYRPGLPLHEFMSVFVRPPEATDAGKIVTHFEQMHLSACYKKSAGKFTCTSCHDPHASPVAAEKDAFYRQRCLTCHEAKQPVVDAPRCNLPLAQRSEKQDNCATCHLPRNASSNANHLVVTDHRVLRRPALVAPAKTESVPAMVPLVPFHRASLKPDDEVFTRDLGLALVDLGLTAEGPMRDALGRRAIPFLDHATAYAPDDVPALEAHGIAVYAGNNPDRAMKILQQALERAPDREVTLTWAAIVAEKQGNLNLAQHYAQRLVDRYPKYFNHHERLAVISVRKQDWPKAKTAAEEAVRLEPFSGEARALLIGVYLATGEHDRARKEFDTLGAIDPKHRDRIRAWFEERIRR